ncbi:MAG TPA: hypothetical protein VF771_02035 [Longimicrobiaceae bacterium]
MLRLTFVLLATIALAAASASAGAAQARTIVQRTRGNDQHGRYDISWVRLTERVATPAVRRRVNVDLEREARSRICEPDPGRRKDLDAWFEMEVTYLGPRLLAIQTSEETFCGGAYPNHGPGSLLYDLRTGARLDLESQIADARAFRRFLARRVLAAAPRDAGECSSVYTDEMAETPFIYILHARTLGVIQDYPHAIQACAYETPIPHADLLRFVKPGSPLQSLRTR